MKLKMYLKKVEPRPTLADLPKIEDIDDITEMQKNHLRRAIHNIAFGLNLLGTIKMENGLE